MYKLIAKSAAAVSLAFAASAAFAGHDLGAAPTSGPITFSGERDSSWYVTLDPGQYAFTSDVTGGLANDVWLSFGGDTSVHGANDIAEFTPSNGNVTWDLANQVVNITAPGTRVFVNIDLTARTAPFTGTLSVSAVPEPASAALLLAGLGMLGFVGRRRT